MAYKRRKASLAQPDPVELARNMAGIGMILASDRNAWAPIEETLLHASVAGLEHGDLRALGLLTDWMEVHHSRVNADALVRLILANDVPRVRAYWSAIALWLSKDRRLDRLQHAYKGPDIDLLDVGTPFHIMRKGQDPRFVGSPMRVPHGALRHRPGDIESPEILVRHHTGYRNRVIMGPTWRSDVWTVLEKSPELCAADAARSAGCSFATAWQTSRDFALHRSISPEGRVFRDPSST